MGTPMFNFRADEDVIDAFKAAAESESLKVSAWAREVLSAVAFGGVTMEDLSTIVDAKRSPTSTLSPHPVRFLAVQSDIRGRREEQKASCSHPKTAERRYPFTVVCTLCGTTLKNL